MGPKVDKMPKSTKGHNSPIFYGTCPKVNQVTNNSALRSTLIMSILAQTLFPRFGKQKIYNISSEKGHNSLSTWQAEKKKYGFANLMWSSHQ